MTSPTMAQAPFDSAASRYDLEFTQTPIGRLQRNQVWTQIQTWLRPNQEILELGCGTGEDAVQLARDGRRVLATDLSPAMLAIARQKRDQADLSGSILFEKLDLAEPQLETSGRTFDLVFSNFGALNCVPDLRPIAEWLAERTQPGAILALVWMSRLFAWEIGWHLRRLQPSSAFRRLSAGRSAHTGGGGQVLVWYPNLSTILSAFQPGFRLRAVSAIGAFVPPSYLNRVFSSRTWQLDRLDQLDRALGTYWPIRTLGDHSLITLERHDFA